MADHHDELAELHQLADLALDLSELDAREMAIDQSSLWIQRCNARFEEAQTSASSLHAVLQDHIRDILLQAPKYIRQAVAFWAYTQGHPALFGFLLRIKQVTSSKRARNGHTLLSLAIERGDRAVVEEVLQQQPNIDDFFTLEDHEHWRGLRFAAAGGHLGMVELFLGRNADVDAVSGRRNRTALFSAAAAGHPAVVDRLLLANADPNATDRYKDTALNIAAKGGHLAVVDHLLLANADPNATNQSGNTALNIAAKGGHLAVVDRLLLAGADFNRAGDRGATALVRAASNGDLAIVERLLLAGVDIGKADHRGETALHKAAAGSPLAIVDRLLLAGADVDKVNSDGMTALRTAVQYNCPNIIERVKREIDIRRGSSTLR